MLVFIPCYTLKFQVSRCCYKYLEPTIIPNKFLKWQKRLIVVAKIVSKSEIKTKAFKYSVIFPNHDLKHNPSDTSNRIRKSLVCRSNLSFIHVDKNSSFDGIFLSLPNFFVVLLLSQMIAFPVFPEINKLFFVQVVQWRHATFQAIL